MDVLVLILALLGVAALLQRLARSLLRLALRSAEAAASAGLAEASAQRGDVTGLVERQAAARNARRSCRRDLFLTLIWLVWLLASAFSGWTREAYALAAPLWLLRTGRVDHHSPQT